LLDNRVRSQLLKRNLDPEDPDHRDEFRFYRERSKQAISENIRQHFEEVFEGSMGNQFSELSQKFLDDELPIVIDEVVNCFPPDWKIFEFYCNEYHKNFNTLLLNYSLQPDKITPNDIIDMIGWVKNTYSGQMQGLGYEPQPSLSEACEPLYEIYRSHIRELMTQWAMRFVEQDIDKEPEIVDGLCVTLAPTLLFESVDVQINIARNTNDSEFFFGTMQETANSLDVFQQKITTTLFEEWENLPFEWILAQINNAVKCCDKIDSIVSTIQPLMDEFFGSQLSSLFDPITEHFNGVSKKALGVVMDIIWRDIQAPLEQLFTLEWYDSDKFIDPIVGTLLSYFEDIDGYIVENYFRRLCTESMDRLTQSYISQLFEMSHTLDNQTADRLLTDHTKLKDFFVKHLKENIVDGKLQVLLDLRELIDAEVDMLPLYFHSIVTNYPDVTVHIIVALLSMRKDLNKKEMAEAIAGLEKVMEKEGNREMKKTIFSTIRLPSKFESLYKKKR